MANMAGPQASIGNGQTMNADAAVYWLALVAAVFGAIGVRVVATEGTRTYARQLYLWVNRGLPGFNAAWHPDSPYAYHLSGRAVDVGSGVGYMMTLVSKTFYGLAGRYGFRATVPGEPWHFEWRLEWVHSEIRAKIEAHNIKVQKGTQTMFAVHMTETKLRRWKVGDKFIITGRVDGISRVSSRTLQAAGLKASDLTTKDMEGLCREFDLRDGHIASIYVR